jgi:hypothetical protein
MVFLFLGNQIDLKEIDILLIQQLSESSLSFEKVFLSFELQMSL